MIGSSLLPNIFYYIGIFLIIAGVIVRGISVWTLKRKFINI